MAVFLILKTGSCAVEDVFRYFRSLPCTPYDRFTQSTTSRYLRARLGHPYYVVSEFIRTFVRLQPFRLELPLILVYMFALLIRSNHEVYNSDE